MNIELSSDMRLSFRWLSEIHFKLTNIFPCSVLECWSSLSGVSFWCQYMKLSLFATAFQIWNFLRAGYWSVFPLYSVSCNVRARKQSTTDVCAPQEWHPSLKLYHISEAYHIAAAVCTVQNCCTLRSGASYVLWFNFLCFHVYILINF